MEILSTESRRNRTSSAYTHAYQWYHIWYVPTVPWYEYVHECVGKPARR